MRIAVLAGILFGVIGCGMNPGQVADSVPVTGQVTFGDGKPVKEVLLSLQPMDCGSMASLKVGGDGTFSGKVVPGKYAYFFGPQDGKTAALKAVPKEYRAAHMERTVVVSSSGGELQIKLN